MPEDSKIEKSKARLRKGVEMYQAEIVKFKEMIELEKDEAILRYNKKMLLESQKTLENVLKKISELEAN